MAEFEFVLVIEGSIDDPTTIDELFEAGCGDATFGSVDGVGYGEFQRESTSLLEALRPAIRGVESVPGLRVLRVEPDDLVTLSEIAERLGRTRESVRLLTAGKRGKGDFPPPISHLRSRFRLWRWSDVTEWTGDITSDERQRARLVASMNAALELRRRSDLPAGERRAVEDLAAV